MAVQLVVRQEVLTLLTHARTVARRKRVLHMLSATAGIRLQFLRTFPLCEQV